MEIKKISNIFLFITIISAFFLIYLWYKDYKFNNSALDEKIIKKIEAKTRELKALAYKNYNITYNIPIIISDKMKNNLFGMAIFNKKDVAIYLNKNRFKENLEYMIEDTLPHEYAHAIMFLLGDFSNENAGHTLKWENICKNLQGKRCDRFVTHDDIIIEKTNPF
ncbi:hypothetical protein CRU99_02295 [Malaciobacter mytili]|uniref:SprT-like domain-containing protein n=1 Tax=Malaciobacter mytili LMG 24559 TaxID=1032238 RepID=A0AAX2AIS0_9BACT|nr:SprT-like domain-containing protein [Malaciobacter mytili]AXH14597.1 SprT-like domain-containing protein [Malaciobacter mytili LMG 24559]RXI47480.1 hypothetical protein CRU99_02295 [Malaciobacter mytili]RXK16649.1 hypothetical protein CP985_02595 [Malaciobacter mytili LMG 24559]